MKHLITLLFSFHIFILTAQTEVIDEYLRHVNTQALLYNGEEETKYTRAYINQPYFIQSDYAKGEILYNDILYKDISLRIDLYKHQLITLTPDNRFHIILSPENLSWFNLYGQTFIYHSQSRTGNSPRSGYYIQIYNGEKISVIQRQDFLPSQKETDRVIRTRFREVNTFYGIIGDQYFPLKNKSSIINLFPQYKKEINNYVRQHKLNFRKSPASSLHQIAELCDTLNKSI